ncbi:MAG: hypothetical protein AB8B55_22995 [Mariniblastus sp.]
MYKLTNVAKLLLVLVALLNFAGCGETQESIGTEYGRIRGVEGSFSINGTSVLADMFAERDFLVKRRSKISPRINKFQTIVWMPDDRSVPSQEAIEALNEWLMTGWERTLIYVGREYDCEVDYISDVVKNAPVDEQEEWLRRLAEAKIERELSFFGVPWESGKGQTCEWFEIKPNPSRKTKKLSGDWADGIRSNTASVEIGDLLAPIEDGEGDWTSETRLSTDGKVFAFELTNDWLYDSEGKIIVVSNGSFLLNYGLVKRENRILAGRVIDSCDQYGDVLFLESGPSGIKVSSGDSKDHSQWSWIAEAPLRYIVPHFLAWGILFCFVFFPIFGRPKGTKKRSTSTFRNHINAIGKMLGKSKMPNQAIATIEKYEEMVSGESKRKTPNP